MSVTHGTDTNHPRNFAMILAAVIFSVMSGGLLLASVAIVAGVSTVIVELVMIIGCIVGFVIGMVVLYQRDFVK